MQFLANVNIDFMKQRKLALLISGSLIILSLISLVLHGGPRYGIDFLGGIELRLHFEKNTKVGDVRDALLKAGFENPTIKRLSGETDSGTDVLVFVQKEASETMTEMEADGASNRQIAAAATDLSTQIESALSTNLPDNPFIEVQKNLVGPKIGSELRDAAIGAILIALALILVYISYRFEFKFALGAIIALFHDVVITLGIFSLLNLEISLSIIAAFLTIVGYSLNDTIVVYDRIRENMKIMRKETLELITNQSINQSLSRTIITSLTTLFVVLFLYFFGGEVIKYFAFAMLVGIVVGTYSSIYIASPVIISYHNRFEVRKSRKSNDRSAEQKAKKKTKA